MAVTTQPTIGRIVHYVLPSNGKHRMALVVETYPESKSGQVNLLVARDGINDGSIHQLWEWATAINHNQEYKTIGTWHFCEQEENQRVTMASHEQRINELEQAVNMIATMIQQRAAIRYEPVEELMRPVVTSMSEAQSEAAAIKYKPAEELTNPGAVEVVPAHPEAIVRPVYKTTTSPVTEHKPARKR